jgi:hypothetical protein
MKHRDYLLAAAVLCFTPAFTVYGFGGVFELLPLVVAIPSWLASGGPAWASAMLMAHFGPMGVVGIVALGLAEPRRFLQVGGDGIAPADFLERPVAHWTRA